MFAKNSRYPVEVELEMLDVWCEDHDIWPDFVKIDVEGAEKEILAASPNCVAAASFFLIEYWNAHRSKNREMTRQLYDAGFKANSKAATHFSSYADLFFEKR
jgi:hypothetical protein